MNLADFTVVSCEQHGALETLLFVVILCYVLSV